ncbi:tetraspanin-19 [Olea europaea subsp. europaea]|uniref:Tetraspanin-19 n=1 Tax=Olea europaea subsp. europaea TaxID=158383 RepID=A0A8S0TYV8_OLEEU|nr:tetraspanin-19 [Olea europaea subsp. europaea]
MSRVARICFQSLLKVVNSGIGIVGIALIVYALWMFMVWQRHLASDSAPNAPIPWFIYTIIGLGVSLCVITCSGHIAAETANGCCLYIYMVFIFMLLVLEAAVTADVFLNSNWEEVSKTGLHHLLCMKCLKVLIIYFFVIIYCVYIRTSRMTQLESWMS